MSLWQDSIGAAMSTLSLVSKWLVGKPSARGTNLLMQ